MLASTVQFSTNDQPTTPPTTPCTAPTAGLSRRSCLAETTTTGTHRPGCSLRTQQGAHHLPPATPADVSTTPRKGRVLHPPATTDRETHQRLRHRATPPPHTGGTGHHTAITVHRSLERR